VWFAVLLGVAMAVLDGRLRTLAIGGTVAAVGLLVWATTAGPLRGSFTTMDAEWLAVVANKDSLFASDWPLWAWALNLSFIAIAWGAWRVARADSHPAPEFTALLWGATALVALFLLTLPLVLARVAFPVQLQISRVFWLVEFMAIIAVIGLARGNRAARSVAIALVVASVARGAYAMTIEHPHRPIVAVRLPPSDWEDAMRWVRAQPDDTHVLADPGHAWKYGSSVRVSAQRDVFLEEVKDSAIAIYSRDVAVRTGERTLAIGDFDAMTADRARALAGQYDLDYLVTEADLQLPLAYKNGRFRIYTLRP
jgi:hypothetical protein